MSAATAGAPAATGGARGGDRRDGGRAGDRASRDTPLLGNRIWRVDTPDGPVAQKLYLRRTRWPREELRALLTRLGGRKTSPRAAVRRETERALLRAWREAGVDVPRELSERHPELAGPRVLVLEWVEGPLLLALLKRKAGTPPAERDRLLRRFGADWRRRHETALRRSDPSFIQEHGSLAHVIVAGDRFVTFDLEQGFRPGGPVPPALAKEVADTLRTLMGRGDPDRFRDDVRAVVAGYAEPGPLRAAVDSYLRPSGPRALVRAVDRRRERMLGRRATKYAALEVLDEVLRETDPEVATDPGHR